jgi:SMEK domain-containing protein
MEFRNLKNVNAERRNFPAIDLADDKLKVGVQVTATGSLEKIKSTLATAIRHGLHEKYSRIVVYVLTKEQDSYYM